MKKLIILFLLLCPLALRAQGWSEYQVQKDTLLGTGGYTEFIYKGEGFTFKFWDKYEKQEGFYSFELDLDREPYITTQYREALCECHIGVYDLDGNFLSGGITYLVPHKRTNKVLFDVGKVDYMDESATLYLASFLKSNRLRFVIPLAGTKEDLDIWIEPKK